MKEMEVTIKTNRLGPIGSRYGDLPELAWHAYDSVYLYCLIALGLGIEFTLSMSVKVVRF